LELVVVIAVIVILMGVFVATFRHISNSSKASVTKVAMENAKTLLQNYKDGQRNALATPPIAWVWQMSDGTPIKLMTSPAGDFWRVPGVNTTATPNFPDPLVAPGQITAEAVSDTHQERDGSVAVINTQIAMQKLRAMASNRELLDRLPSNQKRIPEWAHGQIANGKGGIAGTQTNGIPTAGSTGVIGDGNDTTENVLYVQGVQVAYRGTTGMGFYRCKVVPPASLSSGSGATNPESDTGNWDKETDPAPLLLDGWGNPIILVPASGLRVRVNTKGGAVQTATVISPDHQPFWASAGPDGDFSNGDDNIYSFEN
jgi:type II secretory pathway pseudopilin PulG